MLRLISAFAGGKAIWWAVGLAVAGSLALHGWQALKVSRLETQVATLTSQRDTAKRDLKECEKANKEWDTTAQAQQAAQEALQATCDARVAQTKAALETLRESEIEALRQERLLRRELRTVLETVDCEHLSQVPVCPAAADRLRDNP